MKTILEAEGQEISEIMDWVEQVVGRQVEGVTQRQGPAPGIGDHKQGRQPQQQAQFVRMKDQKIPRVVMVIGGVEEFAQIEIFKAESVGVLDYVVEVDEDAGQEESRRRRKGPPQEVDQAGCEKRKDYVVAESDGSPSGGECVSVGLGKNLDP